MSLQSYDPSERSDAESISWLICFESTHELSKFSIKLAEEWKKTFQVNNMLYIATGKRGEKIFWNTEIFLKCSMHVNSSTLPWLVGCLWLGVLNIEYALTIQIDIDFTDVKDDTVKQRAYKAVDLMQASRYRSDSITRGRGVPLMI